MRGLDHRTLMLVLSHYVIPVVCLKIENGTTGILDQLDMSPCVYAHVRFLF